MDVRLGYDGAYNRATYGPDGLRRAFERIVALDPSRSDNVGRVRRLLAFAAERLPATLDRPRRILDVGSGLCVFLHRMKAEGWECVALDPDPDAVRHAREVVGIQAVSADLSRSPDLGRFEAISFNKVLEHVGDPVKLLAPALPLLSRGGFVYVEVPDADAAASEGPGREEFFIDHVHVFSAASLARMAGRAGFRVRAIETLREPSGKFTLRGFLVPPGDDPAP
jgi:SAM-dependent methyltransferase